MRAVMQAEPKQLAAAPSYARPRTRPQPPQPCAHSSTDPTNQRAFYLRACQLQAVGLLPTGNLRPLLNSGTLLCSYHKQSTGSYLPGFCQVTS
jgi:hypothetical protein